MLITEGSIRVEVYKVDKVWNEKGNTVKLGIKELLNKEQIGNSKPFPETNLIVYLINSEQIGIRGHTQTTLPIICHFT